MKKNKTNQTKQNQGFGCRKIDVESIYSQMKSELSKRNELQEKMNELWKVIAHNHCDRSAQMASLTKSIGGCSHRLNQLVSKLTQYKKTHKAMNLAYDYLTSEIARLGKIVQKNEQTVRLVNNGMSYLIDSHGRTHTNTSRLAEYVKTKKEMIRKLGNWKSMVARYVTK